MIYALVFFLFGFLIALFATPTAISYSRRGFGLDVANETRKRHEGQIPRIGGLPVMIAVTGGVLNILWLKPEQVSQWLPVLLGGSLMFALGLWDDIKPLGARKKLAGQLLIASLVYWMGLGIDNITYPGAKWSVALGAWSYPATVFWLIAVPNIVNLIDGFDGLATGLGTFMAVTLGIVGLISGQLAVAYFAFLLAGSLLGFLVFNFPPAKIFLGDGGAYLIGFLIAGLSLLSSNKGSVAAVLFVTVVVLGIPIIDTTFAIARRGLRGFPLFSADDEHIHHRLQNLGFSKRRIVLGVYGVCVVLSLVGLSIVWTGGRTIPIAIGTVFLMAVFALRYLGYIKNWGELHKQVERVFARRTSVRYALLQAQLLDMELERCASAAEFWLLFHQTLQRVGFLPRAGRPDGAGVPIHVKYNGSTPWTLFAPENVGTLAEWQRIAECFRPVYIKAVSKWPSPAAD
jgi:UDP-GlcNAc:undecaprenyl-phosphate/decaprenyl-phosphate GlcNAc-1-phosphate transferase